MIIDSLDNIELYGQVSKDLFLSLQHLNELKPDVEIGTYHLNGNVKVIICEYNTKTENQNMFESHKHVIDIQYPIIGKERVQWSPLVGMKKVADYDQKKDRTFYTAPSQKCNLTIGKRIFAIFFREDAHNPSLAVDGKSEVIKKVTIKIRDY